MKLKIYLHLLKVSWDHHRRSTTRGPDDAEWTTTSSGIVTPSRIRPCSSSLVDAEIIENLSKASLCLKLQ